MRWVIIIWLFLSITSKNKKIPFIFALNERIEKNEEYTINDMLNDIPFIIKFVINPLNWIISVISLFIVFVWIVAVFACIPFRFFKINNDTLFYKYIIKIPNNYIYKVKSFNIKKLFTINVLRLILNRIILIKLTHFSILLYKATAVAYQIITDDNPLEKARSV